MANNQSIIPAGESANPLAAQMLDGLLDADVNVILQRLASLLPPSWFDGELFIFDYSRPQAVFSATISGSNLIVVSLASGKINVGDGIVWPGGPVSEITGDAEWPSGSAIISGIVSGSGSVGTYTLSSVSTSSVPNVDNAGQTISMTSYPVSSNTPVLKSFLSGGAYNLAFVYSLYLYVIKQSRLATMTGVWLDRYSYDFFGSNLLRRTGELDNSYRLRIQHEILRARQTRFAISDYLEDLTGTAPLIAEPWNPSDAGGWNTGSMGYNVAGFYGSLKLNNQIFITVVNPVGQGVPNIAGYSNPEAGYGQQGEYVDPSMWSGPITNADIYAAVDRIKAAGITAWVAILGALPKPNLDTSHSITFDSSITFDDGVDTWDHF